jgi:hypothetical protein
MVVDPRVEFKPVEGDALGADRDFGEVWPDLRKRAAKSS